MASDQASADATTAAPILPDRKRSGQRQAEVLLVTVTEIETRAVFDALAAIADRAPSTRRSADHTYYNLGEIGGARVWLVRSEQGAIAPGGAFATLYSAIDVVRPAAIVLVGTAFGLDASDQQIGDVLIARQLVAYEPQRVGALPSGEAMVIARGDRASSSPRLLDRCRDGALHWPAVQVRVQFGLMLSGEKLLNHAPMVAALQAREPEAIGGEQEGVALYAAAVQHKLDWIVIKAIAYTAGGADAEDNEEHQALAAHNAAMFTLYVIGRGGFAAEPSAEMQPLAAAQRRSRRNLRLGFALIMFLCVGLGVYYATVALLPMDNESWNVVLADVGWDDGDGIARADDRGKQLADRMLPLLTLNIAREHWRKVGTITGNPAERQRQAVAAAHRLRASVVVYGVLRRTGPESAEYWPEIYINPDRKSASVAISEIVGSTQLGLPIPYIFGKTRGDEDIELNRRLKALEAFLNGVRDYSAEHYAGGNDNFFQALCWLGDQPYCREQQAPAPLASAGQADVPQSTAVLHLFLAAVAIGEVNATISAGDAQGKTDMVMAKTQQALTETALAHRAWNDYARPYVTRAAAFGLRGNALLQANPAPATLRVPPDLPGCFATHQPDQTPTAGFYIGMALRCYDEALQVVGATDEMGLDTKISYGRATLLLTRSISAGEAHWSEALALTAVVVERFAAAQAQCPTESTDNPHCAEKQRLRRLAAHAYARRGFIAYYGPVGLKNTDQAIQDYQRAVDLLIQPLPDFSCAANTEQCYKMDLPYIRLYREQLSRMQAPSALRP